MERQREEGIVDAYAHFLNGDVAAMDAALAELSALGARHSLPPSSARPLSKYEEERRLKAVVYYDRLREIADAKAPLSRLLAGMRRADSEIFLHLVQSYYADVERRTAPSVNGGSALDGTWLRLPCRSILGRTADFAVSAAALGEIAGPLLSCPAEGSDFARLEALARDPASLSPSRPIATVARPSSLPAGAGIPNLPWDRETAVVHVGDDPAAAEPVLEQASRLDALGKLDLALFLHTFRSEGLERNARIAKMLEEIIDLSMESYERHGDGGKVRPAPYDGSDASLFDILEAASSSHAVNTASAFYAIPCAILLRRPALVGATAPRHGGNRDNFIPRSGCSWGRGVVKDFPTTEVKAFIDASTAADGSFIGTHGGTLRFSLQSSMNASYETMHVNPRAFLRDGVATLNYPYQVWGYGSLTARATSLRLKSLYDEAALKLAVYNSRLGLTPDEAARAAKVALFASVWGAECGGQIPQESLRGLIMDLAPLSRIETLLAADKREESPELTLCAKYAPLDPLLHVAVGYPAALELLLARTSEAVDQRNAIGKTALMAAVQVDQSESVRMLLGGRNGAGGWSAASQRCNLAAGRPFQPDASSRRAHCSYVRGRQCLVTRHQSAAPCGCRSLSV